MITEGEAPFKVGELVFGLIIHAQGLRRVTAVMPGRGFGSGWGVTVDPGGREDYYDSEWFRKPTEAELGAMKSSLPAPGLVEVSALLTGRLLARYKNRNPDPGVCEVASIDWEESRITLRSKARIYYCPSFDEIELVGFKLADPVVKAPAG